MALDRWGPRRVYSAILLFAVVPNTVFAFAADRSRPWCSAGCAVRRRRRVRRGHPHGVGVVPAPRGRHGRGRLRRVGELRLRCRGVLAARARRRRSAAPTAGAGRSSPPAWSPRRTGSSTSARSPTRPRGVTYASPAARRRARGHQPAVGVGTRRAVRCRSTRRSGRHRLAHLAGGRHLRHGLRRHARRRRAALLAFQEWTVLRVNRPALRDEYPVEDQYPVRNVAVLCLAYFATFGPSSPSSRCCPASSPTRGGFGPAAGRVPPPRCFAFMNLAARPAGGVAVGRPRQPEAHALDAAASAWSSATASCR